VHAHTTFGRIGVKVWIYKGEVFFDAAGNVQPVTPMVSTSRQGEEDGRGGRGSRGQGRGGRGDQSVRSGSGRGNRAPRGTQGT